MKNKLQTFLFIKINIAYFFTGLLSIITLYGILSDQREIKYITIVQLLGLSIIAAFLQWLAFSDVLFKKLANLFRIMIFLFGFTGSLVIFFVLFDWFSSDTVQKKLFFIFIFVICLIGYLGGLELYHRVTGDKYTALLKEYKANHEGQKEER